MDCPVYLTGSQPVGAVHLPFGEREKKMKSRKKITDLETVDKIKAAVVDVINKPENFHGDGEDAWTITDSVIVEDKVSATVLNALIGRNIDGSPLSDGAINFENKVRLLVLSRQACTCDSNGDLINSDEKTFAMDPFLENAPGPDDKPVEGDLVVCKRGLRDGFNKMSPYEISSFERQHWHEKFRWRNGMRNNYKEYKVDADGCINVDTKDAIGLLQRKGERIAFPKFATKNSNRPGDKQRLITNWLYREVSPDYKKPAAATQPSNNSNNNNQKR
jgi:hypothetical protein